MKILYIDLVKSIRVRPGDKTKQSYSKKYRFTKIMVCAWTYRQESTISVAQAMKIYLYTYYPAVELKVVCQDQSRDTVGDAVCSRLYLESLNMLDGAWLEVAT